MSYLNDLVIFRNSIKRQCKNEKNLRWYHAVDWAVSRLYPQISNSARMAAYEKHTGKKSTYCITMWPEDHKRLIQLGKELHIPGGLSGVLAYLAQNAELIHE